jgi:hypothetical protein
MSSIELSPLDQAILESLREARPEKSLLFMEVSHPGPSRQAGIFTISANPNEPYEAVVVKTSQTVAVKGSSPLVIATFLEAFALHQSLTAALVDIKVVHL